MTPPSDRPRLDQIDPARLGREIETHVRAFIQGLAEMAGLQLRPNGRATLGAKVAAVASYAKRGEGAPQKVAEAILDVTAALFSSAALGGAAIDLSAAASDTTPIGVVLLAAQARIAIHEDGTVNTAELAALSSLSRRMLQTLMLAGELRPLSAHPQRGNAFAAAEARRWLAERGVAGFAKRR